MNKYNPKIHNRRSIRLKGYDYAQAGLYFVTICCKNRTHLFGKIIDKQMILNDAGKMIEKWYYELENKFRDIQCHEMIVMPNHVHFIVKNVGSGGAVGADLCVCPNDKSIPDKSIPDKSIPDKSIPDKSIPDKSIPDLSGIDKTVSDKIGTDKTDVLGETPPILDETPPILGEHLPILGEHIGSPLHVVVQWFKTMTTNEYIRNVKSNNWERFNGKLWQRNYWEHIIRNEKSHKNISQYIINNPSKWTKDQLNFNPNLSQNG